MFLGGEASGSPRADWRCCGQVLVHRSDGYRAFPGGGAFDRSVAYVARGEDTGQVCLEGSGARVSGQEQTEAAA
jgi:hypothetical protein